MGFRKLNNLFSQVTWGGLTFNGTDVILVQGSSHFGLVKIASPYKKTEYSQIFPRKELLEEIYSQTTELSLKEIRRLRHHMTRRIWMLDGVFDCIEWQKLNKEDRPQKPKLLPPTICYDCMYEGNKYIPQQLKTIKTGLCRCCGRDNIKLTSMRFGWPVDLRHKGFGFTVIGTGRNYTNNIAYYKKHHDMDIYADYDGNI